MTNVEKTIIGIAKVCHEAKRAYCETLGDKSQVPWEEAPAWQQDSAVNGVLFHLEKPRNVEESHNNWLQEKVADGWVYGPEKNPEKKEHPCMLPFDELPWADRFKDALFLSVVMALSPIAAEAKRQQNAILNASKK